MSKTEKIAALIAAPFILFMVYTLIIWSPVYLYAEAECLSEGYPEHRVSVGLERYCMNLDGTITIKVDKQ